MSRLLPGFKGKPLTGNLMVGERNSRLEQGTWAVGRNIFEDAGGDEQYGPTPYLPAEIARQYARLIHAHLTQRGDSSIAWPFVSS